MGKIFLCDIKASSHIEITKITNDVIGINSKVIAFSYDDNFVRFACFGNHIHNLLNYLNNFNILYLDILSFTIEELFMIIKQIKDEYGNLLYEEHDDGYIETNEYYEGTHKLKKSVSKYKNGIIETSFYSNNTLAAEG